jgi:glycosyltransferase involved in cell wall biosynthesis
MACEAIIVASKTPPVEEVIENKTQGLLVQFDDPSQVAQKVIDVLTHPDEYMHLRINAREKIEKEYDFYSTVLPKHLSMLDRCSSDQFELSEFINETAHI